MAFARVLIALAILSLPALDARACLVGRAHHSTQTTLQQIGGTYEGEVLDGGQLVPQTMRFFRDPAGRLIGSYTVHQGARSYEGQLLDSRVDGPFTVTFTWRDHHGEGVIALTFAPDGDSFTGNWGVAAIDPTHTVQGRRPAR